jgi:hypothetical protein
LQEVTANTVKPVLNGNIFRSRDYHSIPSLNGNLASAENCSGPLRFRLRQVLLYNEGCWKYLLCYCANDFCGFENRVNDVIEEIRVIGKDLGFEDVDSPNVRECLNSH